MTTETTTMPLLNPAAFPEVEEVRAEVVAISDLISSLTLPIHDIVRRTKAVNRRCAAIRTRATDLLDEMQMQNVEEADMHDALVTIVDAFTGASDLWMLLHTVAEVIHPEGVFAKDDDEADE